MTNPETTTLKRVMLAATRRGWRLFRNNVGVARYIDRHANRRMVRYGLGPDSPDLVGWRPVEITEEMVGQTIAQFTAVEVKTQTGKLRANQKRWLAAVEAAGGVAIVARGAEDLSEEETDAT